jgi:hypothetical protein
VSPVPVVLVDVDCGLERALLTDLAEMLGVVSQRDFAKPEPFGYGLGAQVRVATDPHDIGPGEWPMVFLRSPDIDNALGYHLTAPNGMPIMKVFPLLDDPANRGVTESHELFEALADADCVTSVVGDDGKIRAREPGDPVEATSFEYACASGRTLRCSNWVTPAYFEAPGVNVTSLQVPYDHLGLVTSPGAILPGGYQILYDAVARRWTQETNGERRAYRRALALAGLSRLDRRIARAHEPSAPSGR